MNKILIGLLAISVVGNIFLLTKPKDVVVKQSEPEKVIVKETETVVMDDTELKAKLKKVEAELTQTKQALAKLKAEQELEKERLELAKLEKDISISHLSGEDINKELAEKALKKQENVVKIFEKEVVDEAWAYQTQDTINRIIHEHGDTSLYEIQELQCKTTTCKLTLEPFSKAEGAKMMAGMNASMSLAKNKELSRHRTSFNMNTKTNSLDVYITKPESKGK